MKCGEKGHVTAQGTPCQQNLGKGMTACVWHSRTAEGRAALALKGSLASRMRRFMPKDSLPPDFSDTPSIVRWAETTARLVLTGELDPRAAAEARQLAALTIAARSSDATERIAEVLSSMEHGSAAMLLLGRLKDGLLTGPRRSLPGLISRRPPSPDEETPA